MNSTKLPVFIAFAIALLVSFGMETAFSRPPEVRNYNHNRDEIINGNVDKQNLTLKGRVGRLIIKGRVDGQSLFDLSGLTADEIIIEDRIDGQSTVHIGNAKLVKIGGRIDGQCCVTIGIADHVEIGKKKSMVNARSQ
ncbi:hypothetical protein [Fimbriiglobus ruber]|uniref:hypothetical protein n=1 Tax=Fimbriiglobus ruber TaxID=1908690 RepID=UPI00117AE650|nr:hypothetical protein [Fimbriiglobus ruber]